MKIACIIYTIMCFFTASGCPPCLDIALIADRSSSVGEFRYRNRIIPFLRLIARSSEWTIGMGDDQYQISVTTFAGGNTMSDVVTHWNFGDMETASRSDIIAAISKPLKQKKEDCGV